MNSNELTHVGVLGMKWGVRKNRDSGGTPASRSKQYKKPDLNKTKSVLEETGKIIKSLKDIDSSLGKAPTRKRADIKTMSDEELSAKVRRLNLEKNYSNLTEAPISKGRQYTRDILEVGGSVIGIGASAVAIALAIKQLKG